MTFVLFVSIALCAHKVQLLNVRWLFPVISLYFSIQNAMKNSYAFNLLMLLVVGLSAMYQTLTIPFALIMVSGIAIFGIWKCNLHEISLLTARAIMHSQQHCISLFEIAVIILLIVLSVLIFHCINPALRYIGVFLDKINQLCIILKDDIVFYQSEGIQLAIKKSLRNAVEVKKELNIDISAAPALIIGIQLKSSTIVPLDENTTLHAYTWEISAWIVHYILIVFVNISASEQLKKEKIISQKANVQFSSCAHEIRNPLNSLSVLIKQVKENIDAWQPTVALKNLKIIKFAVKHSLLIAKNLLDIGVLNQGYLELKVEKVALHSVLNSLYHIFKNQMKEKNITFELAYDSAVPEFINTDKMRLTQILINLINNALKFTVKGSIKVSASVTEDNYIMFIITDTGIGIKKEFISIIGNAFTMIEQNDKSLNPQGIGLGLMISKTLASLIGKGLCFESEENYGTKFWFTVNSQLPVSTIKVKKDNDAEYIKLLAVP